MSENKTEQIVIRVSKTEKEMYKQLSNCMNIANVVRSTLNNYHKNYISTAGKISNPIEQYRNDEIKRCTNDIIYFAEKYIYANNNRLKLYDKQKNILIQMMNNDRLINISCRQSGKTLCTIIYAIWRSIFFNNINIKLIEINTNLCKFTFKQIKDSIENISDVLFSYNMCSNIDNYNMSIKLINGNNISCGLNIEYPKVSDLNPIIYNEIIYNEAAFADIAETSKFFKTYIEKLEKTPNNRCYILTSIKFNSEFINKLFLYKGLDKIYEWPIIETSWWDIPGRDVNWKNKQLLYLSHDKFCEEYENKMF